MKIKWNMLFIASCVICICTSPIFADSYIPESTINRFKKLVYNKWGPDNIDLPDACSWVEYQPDLGERFTVCFDGGHVKGQVLLRKNDSTNTDIIKNHIRQIIRNIALSSGHDTYKIFANEYSPEFEKMNPAVYTVVNGDNLWNLSKKFRVRPGKIASFNNINSDNILHIGQSLKIPSKDPHFINDIGEEKFKGKAVLVNQLRLKNGALVTADNVDQFANEVLSGNNITVRLVTGGDGIVRKELTVNFNLIENHLQRRIRMYRPVIKKYADKYSLDEPTLIALIQTESSFNPRARSEAPAYGLMQIVPKTGGRDATKLLFGKETHLSSSYLYNPYNNIQIGSAYLHILATRYWGEVKDPISRQYCVIAAYNGGSGNVARVFASTKSRRNAIEKINTMTSDQVYKKLRSNHRLEETRNYLKLVTERSLLYARK